VLALRKLAPPAADRLQAPLNEEDNGINPAAAIQAQTLISLATASEFEPLPCSSINRGKLLTVGRELCTEAKGNVG
jgi:hypothetical protein